MEVVENDPSDVRTLLKVGDLHAKLGNIEAANDTYRKVGEHYAKDGFFLKAVAVFKQILKLDPGLIQVYVRLAELYQHLGLNSEAMKQYQIVARHYESHGLKKESLDVLKKMAELEPDNFASRVKLAELYSKEGHTKEASEQFRSVVEDLKSRSNLQDLAQVYEKMAKLGVADSSINLELVETYLECSEPKRALAHLQKLFQNDPKNPKILELLARSFIELQQLDKARSVYQELISILAESGNVEEKDRIEAKLRALGMTFESSLSETLSPSSADNVDQAEPKEKSRGKSPDIPLQEVETFLQYGLIEKACETLSQAVVDLPGEASLRQKLIETFQKKEDSNGLLSALEQSLASAHEKGLTEAAQAIQDEINRQGVETSPSISQPVEIPQEEPSQVQAPVSLTTDEEALDFSGLEIVDDEEEDIPSLNLDLGEELKGPELELVDPDQNDSQAGQESAVGLSMSEDEAELEEELNISFDEMEVNQASDMKDREEPDLAEFNESLSIQPDMVQAELKEPESETSEMKLSLNDLTPQEGMELNLDSEFLRSDAEAQEPLELKEDLFVSDIEEAKFFVSQGMLDEARQVYENILSKQKDYEPALEGLKEIENLQAAHKPEVEAKSSPKTSEPEKELLSEEHNLSQKPKGTVRVLAQEEAQDSAANILFDLSDELKEEIRELEDEFDQAKSKGEEDYLSPEEVISEFKKGVARTVAKDDYQTHYHLGIAYKEMGLLDEAIAEFKIASNDTDRIADCASMIGLTLMGKRDFAAAIEVYRKALAQTSPKAQEALGLSYELAEAYIGNGNLHEAYKLFARVRDVDASFRDVRRRAKELELDLGASAPHPSAPEKIEPKEKSVVKISSKKNKISYI